jgi:hypothetical protein
VKMSYCGIQRCPLFGVDRKSPANGQTDANDPEQTSPTPRKETRIPDPKVEVPKSLAGARKARTTLVSLESEPCRSVFFNEICHGVAEGSDFAI